MLKIAVCDDERVWLDKIKFILEKYMTLQHLDCVITCFDSSEELIRTYKREREFQVIFLDVNMKKLDGIQAAKILRMLAPNLQIVFVTAYISYAPEGYKVNAFRYILKDSKTFESAVKECLQALISKLNYKEEACTFDFISGGRTVKIDRIIYIESCLHKLNFYIADSGIHVYQMYNKLDKIEAVLPDRAFTRIHQSYLVNMNYVKTVVRYKAILLDGTEINISKKYYKKAESDYMKMQCDMW